MHWFLDVVKNKYAQFSGRARRKEYWFYTLFNLIFYTVCLVLDLMLNSEGGLRLLSSLFALGLLVPSLAVAVRRLHDTDRSGWWMLIGLIPIIGSLVLLYFVVQDSGPDNQYGPNPKAAAV